MIDLKSAKGAQDEQLTTSRSQRAVWITVAATSAALLLMPELIKLDGSRHADWLQFIGRFHPLAVHIPIGLVLLVPLLEIAGRFRPALREAAGFVLVLATIGCFVALFLGYTLAYGSGDTGVTVDRHMWGGIVLAIGLLFCLLARSPRFTGFGVNAYPVLLVGVLFAMLWTTHQGGTITHGSTYLTQYMPATLKRLAPFSGSATDANSFYGKQIHPILDANCVGCHGASKTEGGLRLDSYALLMKGGKDGPVITPHNAQKSLLIERVTLPTDNKHFMPAEGKPPLKPEEIARIRSWIDEGASPEAATVAGAPIDRKPSDPPIQPVGDYRSLMPEIQKMAQSQGAKLLPFSSQPSDGLILNTVDAAASFGDAQLAEFEKFAPYVVEANLARTNVTDASFDELSKFTHLARASSRRNHSYRQWACEARSPFAIDLLESQRDKGGSGFCGRSHFDEKSSSHLSLQHPGTARTRRRPAS